MHHNSRILVVVVPHFVMVMPIRHHRGVILHHLNNRLVDQVDGRIVVLAVVEERVPSHQVAVQVRPLVTLAVVTLDQHHQ